MAVRATVTAYETRIGNNLIHGVVPVTEGFSGPLFLRTPGGLALPTQNIVAMRGPSDATRTIELRALHNSSASGPQQYTVEDGTVPFVASFHDHVTLTLSSDAPDTFASSQADPLALVTFTSRMLQGGVGTNTGNADDVTRTIIRSGELLSGSGSRLWGYRAHVTTVSHVPDLWLVDMTIQNANVGMPWAPLGADILHDLFFNEIRLDAAVAGYTIRHLHGTPFTSGNRLMTPLPGGKLHVIFQGGAKAYRFAIHNNASLANAAVMLERNGFFVCDRSSVLWSWSHPLTSWYGPTALPVPELDLSGFNTYGNAASYANIKSGLATPSVISFPAGNSAPFGPYHIKGPTDGGISGGAEITQFKGYDVVNTGSVSKLKTYMAVMSMNIDRAASTASPNYTGVFVCDSNQDPVRASDWTLSSFWAKAYPGQMNPSWQGPWPRLNANQWRLNHANGPANLMPGYYVGLGSHELYKDSHMIRPLGATVPLICLLNDPLAKDYLAHHATWCRAGSLEYGGGQTDSFLWSSYATSSANVQAFPDKGARSGFGGRNGGWLLWTQFFDWLVTSDDTKRSAYEPWFTVIKDHDKLAQFKVGTKGWTSYDSNGDTSVTILIDKWEENGELGTLDAAGAGIMESSLRAGPCMAAHACTGDPEWLEMLASACDGAYNYRRVPGTGTYHFLVPTRERLSPDPSTWEVWSEPYVGPGPSGPGEAPNCFTSEANDNFFVGLFICGAFKVDPNHASAWGMIYAFTNTSTAVAARDALRSQFESDPDNKFEHSWGPVLAMLQEFTSSQQVFPSPARVVVRAVAPAVDVDIVVSPSPARVVVRAIAPTRLTAGVDPSPARVVVRAITPSMSVPVVVSPRPARVVLIVPPPAIVQPVDVAPSPALVRIVAVSTIQVNTPLGPKWLLYDENGAEYYLSMDDDGGLPVIDENGTVFSLVLTEP